MDPGCCGTTRTGWFLLRIWGPSLPPSFPRSRHRLDIGSAMSRIRLSSVCSKLAFLAAEFSSRWRRSSDLHAVAAADGLSALLHRRLRWPLCASGPMRHCAARRRASNCRQALNCAACWARRTRPTAVPHCSMPRLVPIEIAEAEYIATPAAIAGAPVARPAERQGGDPPSPAMGNMPVAKLGWTD